MAEKYLWKSCIFRNVTGCNNFSKDFLHFNEADSSKTILQKYSEIYIFFYEAIDLKRSVEDTVKV